MRFALIFILLMIPLLVQMTFGSKSAYRSSIVRYCVISGINILGQILMTIAGCFLMMKILQIKGIRDGLPIAGVLFLGTFLGTMLLLVIAFQSYKLLKDSNQ